MKRALIGGGVALAACLAGVPAVADTYVVIDTGANLAHLVDQSAVAANGAGPKPLDYWGTSRLPGGVPRPALYLRMRYEFDCSAHAVRRSDMTAYGANLQPVFDDPRTSPWRPLPAVAQMPLLFSIACGPGAPAPAGLARLTARDWKDAMLQLRRRLRWPA